MPSEKDAKIRRSRAAFQTSPWPLHPFRGMYHINTTFHKWRETSAMRQNPRGLRLIRPNSSAALILDCVALEETRAQLGQRNMPVHGGAAICLVGSFSGTKRGGNEGLPALRQRQRCATLVCAWLTTQSCRKASVVETTADAPESCGAGSRMYLSNTASDCRQSAGIWRPAFQ
jgi:hypothetical protein